MSRSSRLNPSWGTVVCVLGFSVACTDGLVAPNVGPGPIVSRLTAEYECTADFTAGTLECGLPSAGDANGPRLNMMLYPAAAKVVNMGGGAYSGADKSNPDTMTYNLALLNLMPQAIGTQDGVTADTSRVVMTGYVLTSPTPATAQLANADGIATFVDSVNGGTPRTYTNKEYTDYLELTAPGDTSSARFFRFVFSPSVTALRFTYRIWTRVQYPYGWITVSPGTTPVLEPGATTTLTSTTYDAFGTLQYEAITWSSSNPSVATVNPSTGQVTAVGQGTATITATSTVNAQRVGTREIVVDAAPTVVSTMPVNGSTAVAPHANIVVSFSEAVNVTGSAFTLECPAGSSQAFTVSGNGTSGITLDPTGDLPAATTCTVLVDSNEVSDVDAIDGADQMAGNYWFSYEVAIQAVDDVYPQTITGPISTASTLPTFSVTANDAVTGSTVITFAGWSTNAGTSMAGGQLSMDPSGAGMGQFVYHPPAGFSGTDSLAYTIQNGTSSSTAKVALPVQTPGPADAAPSVLGTTPSDGEAPVAADADLMIFFSEAVNVSTSSFLLECPIGEGELDFTVGGSGTSTITLDPAADLPEQAICTVTVAASAVNDADANDGPDVMVADYVFSFEVGITIHP